MGIFDLFKKKKTETPCTKEASTERIIAFGNVVTKKASLDENTIAGIKNRFIAFDVETTGFSPLNDRIVELGAAIFENENVVGIFSSLVNPGISIPYAASAVNHITNQMLKNAPSEQEVYQKLANFLGDALHGKTVMCAHNARFDFDFLSNTLSRLGYDAEIIYVDTLGESKKYLRGLESYKQSTIEKHFDLKNVDAHRAMSDAENCGYILCRILPYAEEAVAKQRQQIELCMPAPEEMEVCAYIQNIVEQHGEDTSLIRFVKYNSGHVSGNVFSSFVKFKFTKKGNYILVKSDFPLPAGFTIEPCTGDEGVTENVRVYFSSPFDLKPLEEYIHDKFLKSYEGFETYYSHYTEKRQPDTEEIKKSPYHLSKEKVDKLLENAKSHEYPLIAKPLPESDFSIQADLEIHAVHNRVSLKKIKNLNNKNRGYNAGNRYWQDGEELRKNGEFSKAIEMFDEARANGYIFPVLYTSYVMAYKRLKDYDNVVEILDEAVELLPEKSNIWKAHREKAISELLRRRESERVSEEKEKIKAERQAKKESTKKAEQRSRGKAILQLDDEGTVIKEFETISDAAREVGSSTKSIRDAANGIQKHAAGFRWAYK